MKPRFLADEVGRMGCAAGKEDEGMIFVNVYWEDQ